MNRYSRHIVLPEIGEEGQKKLSESRIAILGLGGLGSIMSDSLVRCGIGEIVIADRDFVELSNIQRQTLYDEGDVGKPKADVARKRLKKINSTISIESHVKDVNSKNIEELIKGVDIVLDASDNMKLRYILNDACVKHNIPWIYSAVLGTYGMTMNIIPGKTPCLRCLIPDKQGIGNYDTCASSGILFSLPRIIANVASTEAVKYLVGTEIRRTLLTYDVWRGEYEYAKVNRRNDCDCCVDHKYKFLNEEGDTTIDLCGSNSIQVNPSENNEVDLDALVDKYECAKKVGGYMVRITIEDYELNIFKDGRLIVKGTENKNKAKSLYSEFIGI